MPILMEFIWILLTHLNITNEDLYRVSDRVFHTKWDEIFLKLIF